MKPTSTRILVVEDNLPIREALKMGLELEGYAVQEAADGREALVLLEQSPLPNLILLDLLLPNMNGFEFLNQIRKDSGQPISKIPVIVLSAVAGVSAGRLPQVHEVFSKPVDLNALFAAIRRHCS